MPLKVLSTVPQSLALLFKTFLLDLFFLIIFSLFFAFVFSSYQMVFNTIMAWKFEMNYNVIERNNNKKRKKNYYDCDVNCFKPLKIKQKQQTI